jgi:capsular polysaccharide biosynthesis protein/Mrp family chromosome partitioning ATPase
MDLVEYVRVLRAHKLLVVACVVICVAAAAALAWTRAPMYAANTQFFISTSASNPGDVYQSSLFSQQRIQSYAKLVSSPPVLRQVIEERKLPYGVDQLASEISANVPEDTVLIDVTVTDRFAPRAQAIAASLGSHFAAFVRSLESGRGGTSPVRISVTRPAELPASPVSPNKRVYLVLGVTFGLLLGIVAAVLREVYSASRGRRSAVPATAVSRSPATPSPTRALTTLKQGHQAGSAVDGGAVRMLEAAEVSSIVEAPLLGTVSEANGSLPDPRSASWPQQVESYRLVESKLRAIALDRGLRSFVVTSVVESEGKTAIAASLGLVIAQAGHRVIVVDANFRNPTLSKLLGRTRNLGLTDVMAGFVDLESALEPWQAAEGAHGRLDVLASGRQPWPEGARTGSALPTTLARLGDLAEVVIVDSPALLPRPADVYLAGGSVGAILVTRAGSTRMDQLQQAIVSLRAVSAPVVGVVLNEPSAAHRA